MCDKKVLYQAIYPASRNYVEKIITRAETSLEGLLSNHQNMQLQLALEEVIVNIIDYAYVDSTDMNKTITIELCHTGESIILEIKDSGIAYNPLTRKQPVTATTLEDFKVGGLGISFIRKIADKMDYKRIGNENVLTLAIDVHKEQE